MSFTVFQVDDASFLTPYDYERDRLSHVGASLLEGFCLDGDEVIERAAGADALWLSWKPAITGPLLERLPRCRLVVRWGIGYDQIDVPAATELGVAIANAPTYGTQDVAEHTLALLLSSARRIHSFHEDMRRGGWSSPDAASVHRLSGRTVGLIGVGRIGSAFAGLARGIGLRVIAVDSDRTEDQLRAEGIEPVELRRLMAEADFISLHVPLTASTRGLISDELLALVKPGAILVNTSRGPVVDEQALLRALDSGRLAGAALDVFEHEPLPEDSPLRQHPGVLLTPHYAGFSAESWAALRDEMCTTTIDFLTGGWSDCVVNPEVRTRIRQPLA